MMQKILNDIISRATGTNWMVDNKDAGRDRLRPAWLDTT